jgi:two-component system chemotaxis response regulator CheY
MLRTLIVEDEFTSRMILNALLMPLGRCDTVRSGDEAVKAFAAAMRAGTRYDLVCLDISMPGALDGQGVLKEIRDLERDAGLGGLSRSKVIMTTASRDRHDIMDAFRSEADAYLIKPIEKAALLSKIHDLGLVA